MRWRLFKFLYISRYSEERSIYLTRKESHPKGAVSLGQRCMATSRVVGIIVAPIYGAILV